ncbi:MAG: aldo/keto reductase [Anaerolineales bacterium]
MRYRTLGRSGLHISEIGLGTLNFGDVTSAWDARQIMDQYVHMGGNYIDTHAGYRGAEAESIIGDWMRDGGHRSHIILGTKAYLPEDGDPNHRGLSRQAIQFSVEQSLRRLQTDYVDLYYLHFPDPRVPLDESLYALEMLIQAGKVRYGALSNAHAWQAMHALSSQNARDWAPLTAIQAPYSLLDRTSETALQPFLEAQSLPLIVWGGLGGGFFTGKYTRDAAPSEKTRLGAPDSIWADFYARHAFTPAGWRILETVQDIAKRQGIVPSEVALHWLLSNPVVASVLVGVRHISQIDIHLDIWPSRLEENDLAELASVSQPPPSYMDDMAALAERWGG